ncbi:MAG TPA: four helix bundle protein [Terriglobia bacterium]|nr:four helix bundle protein [Terriglobia bacterium]
MGEKIITHGQLEVYKKAFEAAMAIFELSRKFPKEETYSLTDQIRRSSRSVCSNLAEAWRKRRYEAAFISKLNDVEAEATETQTWLEFSLACGYLRKEEATDLRSTYEGIIGTVVGMINHADSWILPSGRK